MILRNCWYFFLHHNKILDDDNIHLQWRRKKLDKNHASSWILSKQHVHEHHMIIKRIDDRFGTGCIWYLRYSPRSPGANRRASFLRNRNFYAIVQVAGVRQLDMREFNSSRSHQKKDLPSGTSWIGYLKKDYNFSNTVESFMLKCIYKIYLYCYSYQVRNEEKSRVFIKKVFSGWEVNFFRIDFL